MDVLDSLLTLTKGGALWTVGVIVVCLLMDLAVSALTGTQEPIFLLLAAAALVVLLVAGTYTIGKWLWRRIRPPKSDATA